MPFRALYRKMGVKHPEAYNLLTLAVGAIACMAISILVSVSVAREADRDRAMQDEKNRAAACITIEKMQAVYKDAELQVGKDAYAAWRSLAVTFQCRKG